MEIKIIDKVIKDKKDTLEETKIIIDDKSFNKIINVMKNIDYNKVCKVVNKIIKEGK